MIVEAFSWRLEITWNGCSPIGLMGSAA
jgi:hypothetical protein